MALNRVSTLALRIWATERPGLAGTGTGGDSAT